MRGVSLSRILTSCVLCLATGCGDDDPDPSSELNRDALVPAVAGVAGGPVTRAALSYIPGDAVLAVVAQPKQAAESPIAKALLELEGVQAELKRTSIRPEDVLRVIYTEGAPTAELDTELMIVQFAKPAPQDDILKDRHWAFPFEDVKFNGLTYHRYVLDDLDHFAPGLGDDPVAERRPAVAGVLTRYPVDKRAGMNGHVDSSGSGTWHYLSSHTQNPTLADAQLSTLNWVGARKGFFSPRRAKGNDRPAIGGSLEPSPSPPHYAVLRWQSDVAVDVRIAGRFWKLKSAKFGNGSRAIVFVDGKQQFAADLALRDEMGVKFDVSANVRLGTTIDFVIDPRGNASNDSTFLDVTISNVGADAPDPEPDVVRVVEDDKGGPSPASVFFPDDRTMILTSERQLKRLISDPPQASPISRKLATTDLDHDLVIVIAPGDDADKAKAVMAAFAEEYEIGDPEAAMSMTEQVRSAVLSIDLADRQLLEITLDATNDKAAGALFDGANAAVGTLHELRNLIPANLPDGEANPFPALAEGFVNGISVRRNGSQVVVGANAPAGLVKFAQKDLPDTIGRYMASMEAGVDEELDFNDIDPDDGDKLAMRNDVRDDGPAKPADLPGFVDLTDEFGECRVYFPGKPEPEVGLSESPDGDIDIKTWRAVHKGHTYIFSIVSYPDALVQRTGAVKLLDEFRAGRVDEPRGILIDVRNLKFQGMTAQEFDFVHPDNGRDPAAFCRTVLRGSLMYQLEVIGQAPETLRKSYFESLRPLDPDGNWQGPAVAEKPAIPDDDVKKPPAVAPVPAAGERAAALKLVEDVYRNRREAAKSAEARSELAAAILDDSTDVDDETQRYVMLEQAQQLAIEAGDVSTVGAVLDQFEEDYQIDAVAARHIALTGLSQSRVLPADRPQLIDLLVDAGEMAVRADRFDTAVELFTLAQSTARRARQTAILKSTTAMLNDARQLQTEFKILQPALQALERKPNDPDANLAVGRFRCFLQGNYESGLPLLAKGSDPVLQTLARLDMARPAATAEQIRVGDKWWGLAAEHSGQEERLLKYRAIYWYRLAQSQAEGLEKQKIEQRISETVPAVAPPAPVNLLKLVDLRKHVIKGTWRGYRGTLVSSEDSGARVVIPYEPPEEYDLTAVVERKTRNNHFAIGFTVDGVQTMVLFDYGGGTRTSLMSSPYVLHYGPVLTNNKPATIRIAIRRGAVAVEVDGKPIIQWNGQSQLTPLQSDWAIPEGTKLFVGSSSSVFQIQKLILNPVR